MWHGDSLLEEVLRKRESLSKADWLAQFGKTRERTAAAEYLWEFWQAQGVDAQKFTSLDTLNDDLHLDERCWADWDLELFGALWQASARPLQIAQTGRDVRTIGDLIDELAEYFKP